MRGILAVLLLAVFAQPLHAVRVTIGDFTYSIPTLIYDGEIKYSLVFDKNNNPIIKNDFPVLSFYDYKGKNESITIPEKISYKVIRIDNRSSSTEFNVIVTSHVTKINATSLPTTLKSITAYHIEEIERVACANLEIFNWGEPLKRIEDGAFMNCSQLFKNKSAVFPKNLEYIGKKSFYNCSKLRGVNFQLCPKLKEIGAEAFSGCSEYKKDKNDNIIWVIGLESILFSNGIEKIGELAFCNCKNLRHSILIMPETVKEIGNQAFSGCENLTAFNFNKASTIGYGVLSNCSNLTEVQMKNAVNIPERCFKNCKKLSTIVLPASMKYEGNDENMAQNYGYVGEEAFFGCQNLPDELDLPKGIRSIGKLAFSESNANKVTYEGGIPNADPTAFAYSSGKLTPRKTFKINKSSRAADYSNGITMRYAYVLSTVKEIPISNEIQKGAFAGCYDITTLRFPNNVVDITDANVSQYIDNIYDISDVDKDFKSYEQEYTDCMLNDHNSWVDYTTIDYLRDLREELYWGDYQYDENYNLIQRAPYHTVEFHPNVSRIAEKCLSKYPIKKVVFGYEPMDDQKSYSGMSIEANAFATNTDIDTVVAHFSEPPVLDDAAFPKSVYDNAMLIVPDDAVDLYRTTPGWKLFRHLSTSSGIDCVTVPTDESPRDVYNLEGILLIRNASDSDLRRLDRGLYIIGGKKVYLEN